MPYTEGQPVWVRGRYVHPTDGADHVVDVYGISVEVYDGAILTDARLRQLLDYEREAKAWAGWGKVAAAVGEG